MQKSYSYVAYELDGADGFKEPQKTWENYQENRPYVVSFDRYPDIIESCRRVALSRPDINLWLFENEGLGGQHANQEEWVRRYAAMMIEVAKSVKKINPKAKLVTTTTTQIYSSGGIATIEEICREGVLGEYDIVGAHTYRPQPEAPDLAEDVNALIKMLDKYNFKGHISFDEDMNYPAYNIPKYGLDVTREAGFFRAMPLSYDLGVGERMSSAYNARHWLIALRYYPKVERALWHLFSESYLDMETTPTLHCWAPNTLRHVFGKDCRFDREVPLADDVRCYLFHDGDGKPLAALWNINEDVDRERRPPFTTKLPFSPSEVDLIDFVGNRVEFAPGYTLSILPQPSFLRGLKMNADTLASLLEKLDIPGSQKRLLKITTAISSQESVEVKAKNLSARPIRGTLSVQCGNDVKEELNLSIGGEKSVSVKLPELSCKAVKNVPLQINLAGEDGKLIQSLDSSFKMLLCNKAPHPITVDGELDNWPGGGIKLDGLLQDYGIPAELLAKYPQPPPWKGLEDLSATLYTAWDNSYFYLAVAVTDDVFCPPPESREFWKFDSLQVYFDTFCDARNRKARDYDNNDYCYNVYYTGGNLEVSRDPVPEWQLCFLKTGAAPNVKRAFRKTSKGYVYELAFPLSEIAPMALKNGTAIGFAVLINENDNDYRKRVISLTAPEREPYRNPAAWPVLLLIDPKRQ